MSRAIPPCLQRLTLGRDADARAIRRAYARELKLIDQEADLAGFQHLREMYQAALAWAAHQDQETAEPALELAGPGAGDAVTPAPPCGAAPNAVADAGTLAEAVFARLASNAHLLSYQGAPDEKERWEAELVHRLHDDELINITARQLFESRIAQLLFAGAMADRRALFGAAAAVFNWEQDRRRLLQFGQCGVFLDRVIEERTMFQRQDPAELTRQHNVLLRLRNPEAPTKLRLKRDMVHVERMLARFPNFMAVMVSAQVIEKWRSQSLPGAPPVSKTALAKATVMPEPVLYGDAEKGGLSKGWIFFLIIVLVQLVRMASNPSPTPGVPRVSHQMPALDPSSEPTYAPGVTPGKRKGEPGYGEKVQQDVRLAVPVDAALRQSMYEAVMDAIAKDISYRPVTGAPKGPRTVEYVALSGPNGTIYGVNLIKRSTDQAYDDAVKAAILRAKPLPPALSGYLGMQFTFTPGKRPRKSSAG